MTAEPAVDPRRYLPLILGITGMGVLTFNLIAPTLPDLADALGVSRAAIGLVQGVVAAPGVVLAIFIGYLADLKGRRFVAVGSLLIFRVARSGCSSRSAPFRGSASPASSRSA
jgi:MFS family permease